MTDIDVAVVGCGAIATSSHLPALARVGDTLRRSVIVDLDVARAAEVARRFGAAGAARSLDDLGQTPKGVMVLTPGSTHLALTLDALRRGAHVFCEKPLAPRVEDVDRIIEHACLAQRHVAVNHGRRFVPAFRATRQWLAEGLIGRVRHLDITMGDPFNWPAATNAYFGPHAGGRGVLADIGSHILDLAAWWLDGELELVDYHDDAAGGTEAVADVQAIAVSGPHAGAQLSVRLSWLGKLSNRFVATGDAGRLSGGMYDTHHVAVEKGGRREVRRAEGRENYENLSAAMAANFVEVLHGRASPFVSAGDIRASAALIDACYARRRPFEAPWEREMALELCDE